jgi:hypothetical protein
MAKPDASLQVSLGNIFVRRLRNPVMVTLAPIVKASAFAACGALWRQQWCRMPAFRMSGQPHNHNLAGASATARRASSLSSAERIECGVAPTSVDPPAVRAVRGCAAPALAPPAVGAARGPANWRPVSRFSPALTSLPLPIDVHPRIRVDAFPRSAR